MPDSRRSKEMSGKFKKALPVLFCVVLATTAVAKASRNVVTYYLPLRSENTLNSLQESVAAPTRKGALPSRTTKNPPSGRKPTVRKEGFETSVGTSLYDKPAEWTNDQAADAALTPAKVMIMPPETGKRPRSVKKLPDDVNSTRVRIYPLISRSAVREEISKDAVERVEIRRKRLPPPDRSRIRPADPAKWMKWISERLKDCDMPAETVLPTLYWMMARKMMSDGETLCTMKERVAEHLRKCHPWPTVYYAPFNNDVPADPVVQMGAEIIETAFDDKSCPALDLSKVNFQNVEFVDAHLEGHDFSKSNFKGAYFLRAKIDETVFKEAFLEDVLFSHSSVRKAYFKNATVRFSHVYDSDLTAVNFDDADVANTQFRNVRMPLLAARNANFENTIWKNVRADTARLIGARFRNAAFDNVSMDNALISRAEFPEMHCRNCVFKHMFGEYPVFAGSRFDSRTSFAESDISYADFKNAVFEEGVSFYRTEIYHADLKGADISGVKDLEIETERGTFIDKKTKMAANLPDIDNPDYDLKIYHDTLKSEGDFVCGKMYCDALETGRTNLQYLALRARTMLVNPPDDKNDRLWAVCTVGCVAFKDKKLEHSNAEALASFVRERRPWSTEGENLFKPYEPPEEDVFMALRLLTHRNLDRDGNRKIDLSYTDLRKIDFNDSNLRDITFEGANISGADLSKSKTNAEYAAFDKVVFDEFTRFPPQMDLFKPFELPDSKWPDWWDPETVLAIVKEDDAWDRTVDDIPLDDDFIAPVPGMDEPV